MTHLTASAPPYASLAAAYDTALGRRFFGRVRAAFERLQADYGFAFRSAADLGCGTGLFARYLARGWRVPVIAVDRSPAMLAQARRRCRGEPVRFLCQDLRSLCLPQPVDLITANYDVLNHLVRPDDVRRVFGRVHDQLTPGGHFYFDVISPCVGLPPGRWTEWIAAHPSADVRQRLLWDPAARLLRLDVLTRHPRCGCVAVERHLERLYDPVSVAGWLAEAGFTLRAVHDEATGDFAQRCAPRLIFLARRRLGSGPTRFGVNVP